MAARQSRQSLRDDTSDSADVESFDVAISYASEDRAFADAIAAGLKAARARVYYDVYEQGTLWGSNLYDHLSDVYGNRARYCVMLLSRSYATKLWTNHERQAAQARAFRKRGRAYILPVRIDDTSIPGIPETIGYLPISMGTARIVDILLEKLAREDRNSTLDSELPEELPPTWLSTRHLWWLGGSSIAAAVTLGAAILWGFSSSNHAAIASRSAAGRIHEKATPVLTRIDEDGLTDAGRQDERNVPASTPRRGSKMKGAAMQRKATWALPGAVDAGVSAEAIADFGAAQTDTLVKATDLFNEVMDEAFEKVERDRADEEKRQANATQR